MGKKYSNEELSIIRQLYPIGGCDAVVKKLPGRTRAAIATMARQLNLHLSKASLSEVRRKNARSQGLRQPYQKATPTIDTVPTEFERVSSVFHIGERIKK